MVHLKVAQVKISDILGHNVQLPREKSSPIFGLIVIHILTQTADITLR